MEINMRGGRDSYCWQPQPLFIGLFVHPRVPLGLALNHLAIKGEMVQFGFHALDVWMAMGTLPAGRGFTNPHPRGKPCARTRAHDPSWARNWTRTRHPWAQCTRGHIHAHQQEHKFTVHNHKPDHRSNAQQHKFTNNSSQLLFNILITKVQAK